MIFLDTNFIIAYFIKKHESNEKAIEIWKSIENEELITSRYVIVEVLNNLNMRFKSNIELSEKVCNSIFDKFIVIDDCSYHKKAFGIMSYYYPDRLPFADCLYLALMYDLGIRKIISFDSHFDNKEGITRIH